jgi:hypothetical protein
MYDLDPERAYRLSKSGLSTVSLIFVYAHLIGDCQVFVFIFNLYTLFTNILCLKYDFTPPILFLGVENVITLASFMCIAGNTEDDAGLSNYEIVAVATGILWGIHTSHVTYLMTKSSGGPDPYASFLGLEEGEF